MVEDVEVKVILTEGKKVTEKTIIGKAYADNEKQQMNEDLKKLRRG